MITTKLAGYGVIAFLAVGAVNSATGILDPDEVEIPSGHEETITVSDDWVRPANGPLGTPYHTAGSSWSSGYHTGIDFTVSAGTQVKAAGEGTVVTAGWGGAYGNQVVIRHKGGIFTHYAHLSSLSVREGQNVGGGQQIGLSGSTGNSTGPHLHFEVRTGPDYGSDVNPVTFLREHKVTL